MKTDGGTRRTDWNKIKAKIKVRLEEVITNPMRKIKLVALIILSTHKILTTTPTILSRWISHKTQQ